MKTLDDPQFKPALTCPERKGPDLSPMRLVADLHTKALTAHAGGRVDRREAFQARMCLTRALGMEFVVDVTLNRS